MKRFLIVIGAPVVNMGSQAIVRGLVRNIRLVCETPFIEVMANDLEITENLHIDGVDKYSYRYSIVENKWNYERIANKIYRVLNNKETAKYKMAGFIRAAKSADVVFIVGADNYDKSYNSLRYMNETNQFVGQLGAEKFVLYNCSVSDEDLSPEVLDDFKRFKYLTARDSISFQNMKKALPEKDIRFFPDIAFCMEPEEVDLPEGWDAGNMIGINLSSLVGDGRYGISEEEVLDAYKSMIDYIITNTKLKICFIPHVKRNADLSVLRKLNEYVDNPDRAIIINHENYDAAQKKYIISHCRLFVGARTHSTIAAYSSLVPTLVVGYSIKSVGIATDLLGTDKGNVVPVQELKDTDALRKAFISFINREKQIREQLNNTVPSYIASASGVQKLISEILG